MNQKIKKYIFIGVIVILLILLIYLINKRTAVDVGLEFDYIPGNYSNAVVFVYDSDNLTYKMPLTIFQEKSDSFDAVPAVGQDLSAMPYEQQESLLRQYKPSKGLRLTGYSFDTLLALENLGFDFIAVDGNKQPHHPISLFNKEMHLLVFSVDNKADGMINIVYFDNEIYNDLKDKNEIWFTTLTELNDRIRSIEKMEADITTDYKEWQSYVELRNIANSTKIIFNTTLDPKLINASGENVTWQDQENGFYLVLNNDTKFEILWNKP